MEAISAGVSFSFLAMVGESTAEGRADGWGGPVRFACPRVSPLIFT